MMKKETMLAPDTCLSYGFCDFVGGQKVEVPKDPENPDDPDDPDDPMEPEDKAKQKIRELQQQVFQQKQINMMLKGLNRPCMKDTLSEAMKKLRTK